MQEGKRKEAEPMAKEVIQVSREAEALEIYLMAVEAEEQGLSLKEFIELLKARIRAI
jgi:hypothetical protein